MKHIAALLPSLLLGLSPLHASAGPHGGGEHGHGYTQARWAGPCKIERKFRPDSGDREARKCHGAGTYAVAGPMAVVLPAPVVVAAPVMVQPGIVIQGTVRIH